MAWSCRKAMGVVLASGWGVAFASEPVAPVAAAPAEEERTISERERWEILRRLGADGMIPFDARGRALRQLRANLASGLLGEATDSIDGDRWIPLGPSPISAGPASFSGRVTALAAHPTQAGTVYAGGAQGGVWKTTDGGSTWTPLTDTQDSLAIGALAIDPSNPQIVYAGTGEANGSCDAYYGVGILKSTDGGATWSKVGATPFANTSIARIVVSPANGSTLWAANTTGTAGFGCSVLPTSNLGVWRSTNGGSSWSRVLSPLQTLTITSTRELLISPSDPNRLWAGVDESGIWTSSNGGTSWTRQTTGLPASGTFGRIAMAVHPLNALELYASFEAFGGFNLGVWKTTNGGTSWSQVATPGATTCQGFSFQDLCTYASNTFGQCGYSARAIVRPDGTVILGGTTIVRSTDGGASWQDACPDDVHVDQHAFARGADGALWVGNDGGVWRSPDGGVSWATRNTNLELTQFYPGASLHPSRPDVALGGTQDNGTPLRDVSPRWRHVFGGDGASSAFDTAAPDTTFYASSQYLLLYKTTDGGLTFQSAMNGLADGGTNLAAFIAPFTGCPADGAVLVAGSNNVWRTIDAAGSWASNGPDPIDPSGARIACIAFAPSDASCGTYAVGLENGKVWLTQDAGGAWREISGGNFTRLVSDLAFDPANPAVLYAALAGFGAPHLWKSTDAGSAAPTWTGIASGLPDAPVNAVLVDPETPSIVYAGSDLGVFRSSNGGSSWASFMNGHPRVAVYDLVANASTRSIVSFTHGRGAFRLAQGCTTPAFAGVSAATDESVCGTGVRVSWPTPSSWGTGVSDGTFEIRRYGPNGCAGPFTTVGSGLPRTSTSFVDTSASPGASHTWRVVATNACATPLATAGVQECSAPAVDAADAVACPGVGDSVAGSKDAGSATFAWSPPACADLAAQEVYGATSFAAAFPSEWTLLQSGTTNAYTEPLDGGFRAFRVRTLDGCGNPSEP
ncbi:MAG TPA: hypothetical protein VF139_08535 [Candidatus Polarisedimenticolaceae bacterium]